MFNHLQNSKSPSGSRRRSLTGPRPYGLIWGPIVTAIILALGHAQLLPVPMLRTTSLLLVLLCINAIRDFPDREAVPRRKYLALLTAPPLASWLLGPLRPVADGDTLTAETLLMIQNGCLIAAVIFPFALMIAIAGARRFILSMGLIRSGVDLLHRCDQQRHDQSGLLGRPTFRKGLTAGHMGSPIRVPINKGSENKELNMPKNQELVEGLVRGLRNQARDAAETHWNEFRRLAADPQAKGIDAIQARRFLERIHPHEIGTTCLLMEQVAIRMNRAGFPGGYFV